MMTANIKCRISNGCGNNNKSYAVRAEGGNLDRSPAYRREKYLISYLLTSNSFNLFLSNIEFSSQTHLNETMLEVWTGNVSFIRDLDFLYCHFTKNKKTQQWFLSATKCFCSASKVQQSIATLYNLNMKNETKGNKHRMDRKDRTVAAGWGLQFSGGRVVIE